jgi:hypothetical protein
MVRGQHPNTRGQSLLTKAKAKILCVAEKYHQVCLAYHQLMNTGPWKDILKPLCDSDMHTVMDADIDDLD